MNSRWGVILRGCLLEQQNVILFIPLNIAVSRDHNAFTLRRWLTKTGEGPAFPFLWPDESRRDTEGRWMCSKECICYELLTVVRLTLLCCHVQLTPLSVY